MAANAHDSVNCSNCGSTLIADVHEGMALDGARRDTPKSDWSLSRPWLIALILVIAVLISLVINAFRPKSPTLPDYTAAVSITMPSNYMRVGLPAVMSFAVINGPKSVTHMDLWVQGMGSWVMESVRSNCTGYTAPPEDNSNGNGTAWNLGNMAAGSTCTVDVVVNPKVPGSHTLNITASRDGFDGTELSDGEEDGVIIHPS
jgi:hypothetical protein